MAARHGQKRGSQGRTPDKSIPGQALRRDDAPL
jgi:hypothetical protein